MDVGEVSSAVDEAVYEAHAAEVTRFASTLVGRDDAADVATDAFLRVTASKVWVEARDPRALWFRAVVFEASSWWRSAHRRRAREARASLGRTETPPPEGDPEVAAALDQLPLQQRAVVVLTYWLDLDTASVAHLLGVSDGTVRKQLARARARLKEALS